MPFFVGFVIHTGGMGQEYAEKRAKRHPKGAANSIHYTLLGHGANLIDGVAGDRASAERRISDSGIVFQEDRVTTPDQLREIVLFLRARIHLVAEGERAIEFEAPTSAEMTAEGLDGDAAERLTSAPWWGEMVDDVSETPDFAEPEASAETVLGYARDVITEYVGKRFRLEG